MPPWLEGGFLFKGVPSTDTREHMGPCKAEFKQPPAANVVSINGVVALFFNSCAICNAREGTIALARRGD